jgi:3-hydroxybutyryl-CoA dehydrogenase
MQQASDIRMGVVGLGLMGSSITTCLLMAGHKVVAVAPIPTDMEPAIPRIRHHLERSLKEGLVDKDPDHYLKHLTLTENYGALTGCRVVVECTIENIPIKQAVYKKIEDVVDRECLLTSNTSAIPISILQSHTLHPERFFGLHWAEPSHTTRFLEIICGDKSDVIKGEYLYELSHFWGKEPTLVRKDIRGFITNRLMYSMYREAMYLVEGGYATVEDVDRACRNNAGYWMTLMGVFRWMDLTGVPAYHTVMKDLFPTLSTGSEVPEMIDKIVREGGRGISNAKGFYEYTPEEARLWEETFTEFSYEIRRLALKYPADVVKKKMSS